MHMLEGLQNLGNTCSVNTLVQCIGHCKHLRDWLLSVEAGEEEEDNRPLLSRELARITQQMWRDQKSLAPWLFLKTLFSCLQGIIRRGEQIDLSELWMLLVDRINEEIGIRQDHVQIEGGRDVDEFTNAWKTHNEKCMSPWLQEVQGWTQTVITCHKCKKSARHYEPFSFLGLDVHESAGNVSRMFDRMSKEEHITKRECDYCHSQASATKSTNICLYPRVLVCCFKRFVMTPHGTTQKWTDTIEIPLQIRFSNGGGTYSLQSIGNHQGSLHGGHYYAVAKNPNDQWVIYDDIYIMEVPDITTMIKNNKDAYMLFYELSV